MQSSSGSPFAEIITSLAVMQQEQHQALLDLRQDQERCFQVVVQAQQEDRERFRSWIDREVRPEALEPRAVPAHLPLHKMGSEDDPEVFLDLFQKTAELSGWPRDQWPMRLVPLLSGESQIAAQQLPVQNLLVFDDLKRAILQRVGRSPEEHRQRFRSLELGESGRPFVLAQQLRDSCRKWLLAEGGDVEKIVDRVVLEQFITRLPRRTAEWVQCHRPTSLDSAIHLAEDHMVACPGVGEPLPSVSLSPSSPSVSLSRPVPLPRSRPPVHPRVPPRGRGGVDPSQFGGPRAPPRRAGLTSAGQDPAPVSPLSPRQSFTPLPATGAAGRSGPACWRCGDPEHFVDRCPVMEVGTMVRVPDAPQAAPGQAGWYQIPTDASDRGLGAVLSQEIEGEERPVLYISRKLSKRETKYSTIEKECLAIRWAVLTLRYYLLGREFTLCSDHAPLQWLHRMKDTNARITRWYLALQPFKFKVVHRPGAQMAVADFLSRNGGGGGLQAGWLPGLSRAVGVCGEGGVVQRSRQRERESGDER
ncbi:uncharacterized protein LOC127513104 isoform X1 [Ctenopharyngodon idella]|uniref:uncharacterized protein LOC127513104 isoform X1 n=1 Tax=Ctenopharyngodon idella TaxID=7959 RepID=UPI00222E6B1E|nr:uncharacterized protein LOC127513104 isoform X1 [Ctenopharyngodon idella]